MIGIISDFFHRSALFIGRQQRDWKLTVIRTSLDRLSYQIIFPYLSIYIVSLGASGTDLGLVNSFGLIAAGLIAPLVGSFLDRTGPKKIYCAGIALTAFAYLVYGVANVWWMAFCGMIFFWVGFSTSTHSCATICGNCLANSDRAKGMTICETVASGLLGMIGPMIATWLVASFGGVSTAGIRPLFFIGFAISIASFFLIFKKLSDAKSLCKKSASSHPVRDFLGIVRGNRELKKWLLISSVGQIPMGMVFPFTQVFAHEHKGAGEFVLGAMVTATALSSIIFSIPLGHLADRIGRKKILYFTIPMFWLSNLLLILSPRPEFLIVVGIFQGFYYIGGPVGGAIERELVPPDKMGRWIGMNRLCKMTLSGLMALSAGLVWDKVGPQYIFIIFVAIDMLVRMPLLISIPETLNKKFTEKQPEEIKSRF